MKKKIDPSPLVRSPIFVDRVMGKWKSKLDTAQIAAELMTAEAFVAMALAYGRDQGTANEQRTNL